MENGEKPQRKRSKEDLSNRKTPKEPKKTMTLQREQSQKNGELRMENGEKPQRKRSKEDLSNRKTPKEPKKTMTPQRKRSKKWGCWRDRKSTRLNSSHVRISYAVF